MESGRSHEKGCTHLTCATCSGLADQERAYQKYGSDDTATYLPEAAARLETVRDFRPYSSRKREVRRCPECGTYYLYETDYEYLVNGTEDEESLSRLTREQVMQLLQSDA